MSGARNPAPAATPRRLRGTRRAETGEGWCTARGREHLEDLAQGREGEIQILGTGALRILLSGIPMVRLLLAVPLLAACGTQPGPETSMNTNESTPSASSTTAMTPPTSSPATSAARTGVAVRLETATFALG